MSQYVMINDITIISYNSMTDPEEMSALQWPP